MEWANLYGKDNQPSSAEISDYITSPLWEELNGFLCESYVIQPKYSYSTCSMQPGWNVKFQKAGRSLCTVYPMPGFFIALVVIGAKEANETELMLQTLHEYTQNLYKTAKGEPERWLMIQVTDKAILDDVKRLIHVRRKIKRGA